jgi:catechol-2,3-dioxygenase
MEVPDLADVLAYRDRLVAAGVEVTGIVDHDFIKSIYFFDPNGLRLEITTRTEKPGFNEKAAAEAHAKLAVWSRFKHGRN